MKIAYLSTFYPFRGGIAQFNASLYRALERQGHKVEAYTFTRQYPGLLFPGKSQYVTSEDQADPVPSRKILDTMNPLTYMSASRKIANTHPDLLIMKFWMPYFAPALGTVAGRLKKMGTKVITVLDNVVPHEHRPGDRLLTQYFLKRNSGFVAMSETVRKDLLDLYPEAHYIVHPHPLYGHFGDKTGQREAQKKLGLPEGKKMLLFFGLIREYKGLDLLLESMAKLPDDYFLLVGGEVYGDEKKYWDLVEQYKLQDRVKINFRYIPDDEVPLYFSAADLNVLPYRSATQSGILSISLHFELPVVITDRGSLKELVEPYDTGLVVREPNKGLLVNAIQTYFDKDLQNTFRSNIRKMKKKYSWDSLAKQLAKFAGKLK